MIEEVVKKYQEFSGVHPACLAVPEIDSEDFTALLVDIRANGLLEPIAVTPDRLLLDGRSRLLACHEAEVKIRVVTVKGDPWQYAASKNLCRRHLTTGQKAMFALAWRTEEEAKAKERQQAPLKRGTKTPVVEPVPPREAGKSRDRAGARAGVSGMKPTRPPHTGTESATRTLSPFFRALMSISLFCDRTTR